MFILKQEITNLTDGIINENIYIKDGKAFIKTADNEFMYNGTWYVKTEDRWLDLQGGIPSIGEIEEIDNPIFGMLFERKETNTSN